MEDDGVVEYCEYRVKPKLLTGDLESGPRKMGLKF